MKEVILNVENVMNTFQRSPISTDIQMEAKTGIAVISILVMFAMIIFAQAGSYQNICKSTKNMNAINVKTRLITMRSKPNYFEVAFILLFFCLVLLIFLSLRPKPQCRY